MGFVVCKLWWTREIDRRDSSLFSTLAPDTSYSHNQLCLLMFCKRGSSKSFITSITLCYGYMLTSLVRRAGLLKIHSSYIITVCPTKGSRMGPAWRSSAFARHWNSSVLGPLLLFVSGSELKWCQPQGLYPMWWSCTSWKAHRGGWVRRYECKITYFV